MPTISARSGACVHNNTVQKRTRGLRSGWQQGIVLSGIECQLGHKHAIHRSQAAAVSRSKVVEILQVVDDFRGSVLRRLHELFVPAGFLPRNISYGTEVRTTVQRRTKQPIFVTERLAALSNCSASIRSACQHASSTPTGSEHLIGCRFCPQQSGNANN